jgi:hypothetical protein
MADMNTITESIDGTSHDFKLLEADIPTLTFRGNGTFDLSVSQGYSAFATLAEAMGYNLNAGSGYRDEPGFFGELVLPKGAGDYGFTVPTSKTLLARAAQLLPTALNPHHNLVVATLTMALKGGGLSLAAAAGQAQNIARSATSAAGKFNHVQSVLVPQILTAAAAA